MKESNFLSIFSIVFSTIGLLAVAIFTWSLFLETREALNTVPTEAVQEEETEKGLTIPEDTIELTRFKASRHDTFDGHNLAVDQVVYFYEKTDEYLILYERTSQETKLEGVYSVDTDLAELRRSVWSKDYEFVGEIKVENYQDNVTILPLGQNDFVSVTQLEICEQDFRCFEFAIENNVFDVPLRSTQLSFKYSGSVSVYLLSNYEILIIDGMCDVGMCKDSKYIWNIETNEISYVSSLFTDRQRYTYIGLTTPSSELVLPTHKAPQASNFGSTQEIVSNLDIERLQNITKAVIPELCMNGIDIAPKNEIDHSAPWLITHSLGGCAIDHPIADSLGYKFTNIFYEYEPATGALVQKTDLLLIKEL
jgi:hypothetical protein